MLAIRRRRCRDAYEGVDVDDGVGAGNTERRDNACYGPLVELDGSSSSLSSTIDREDEVNRSSVQRVAYFCVVDNWLIWEERGGVCWLLRVRHTNIVDGEVSLVSELYRSPDGFEGWSAPWRHGVYVECSSFVDVLRARYRTYSTIRVRPSGFTEFPGRGCLFSFPMLPGHATVAKAAKVTLFC
jgi:hypothetical protein